MTPERWQKVKDLFQAAQDLPRADRAAFLANACDGDAELLHEVESLLASSEKEGSFIDSPAYAAAATLLVDDGAELKRGETIGAYEILSFISRGGMGEVYLAQDRRLNRKVALKVLPASLTKEADRLRRFEQEARAASALNHPNIITIYEILKSESTHVIATEFVEGQTLRQRLSRSRIALADSLDVAIQVSDALSAAHTAGIVHRDIKPENIMLRPDGYVKVLDFGLAKLAELQATVAAEEAVTKQIRTGSGVVMGTAGYMSPEQARGKSVDARSDIFSLGAVIYEMIAHKKPFDGETPSDILASILTSEPPPLTQVVGSAPPELERIVAKALHKNRDERYQTIRDLWAELKALKQDLEFQAKLQSATSAAGSDGSGRQLAFRSVAAAEQTAESPGPVTSISQAVSIGFRRRPLALTAAIVLPIVALAAVAFGVYKFINRPGPTHFQATKIVRLTNSGKVIDARISRDGTYLVYALSDAGKQSLWIRQVTTANDKMILPPAPVGFFGFTFSPDGRELYYSTKQNYDSGTLYRMPILGGTPVKLLEKIDGPVTFSPDGKRMAFVRASFPSEDQSALIIANVDGTGEQSLVTKKKPDRLAPIFFAGPSWSPDGKLIAASVLTVPRGSRIIGFPVAGGDEINLSPDPWPFAGHVEWMPDMSGLLVVAGANSAGGAQLWFLSYPSGEKRQITNDLNQHRAIGVTADGTKFVTVVSSSFVTVWVAPDSDANRAVQLPTGNVGFGGPFGSVALTSSGKIVFSSADGAEVNLWMMDADGQNRIPLTSNAGRNQDPVVSPDDRYIVFSSTRAKGQNIWRMNIDGSNPKQLTHAVADAPSISPDGRWVLYSGVGTTRSTIWKVPIEGGTPVEITNRVASGPVVSPDGKLIAYLYPEGPDPLVTPSRIAIMPFEGGEPIATFAFSPATAAKPIVRWAADGQSILYMSTTNNVTNIWSQPIKGGPPVQVTNFKDLLMTSFAWSPDSKTLVCARGLFTRDAVLISDAKPAN